MDGGENVARPTKAAAVTVGHFTSEELKSRMNSEAKLRGEAVFSAGERGYSSTATELTLKVCIMWTATISA